MEHAAAARARIGEQLGKLDVERNDLARRGAARRRRAGRRGRRAAPRARGDWTLCSVDRAARATRSWPSRAASREALGRDAPHPRARPRRRRRAPEVARRARRRARRVRRRRPTRSSPSPARPSRTWDRSPTTSRSTSAYERAVDACLGDLLQHVVVRSHEDAAAGLRSPASATPAASASWSPCGGDAPGTEHAAPSAEHCRTRHLVRVTGPAADAIRAQLAHVFVADDATRPGVSRSRPAAPPSRSTAKSSAARIASKAARATRPAASSTTKREIKELRERAEAEDATLVARCAKRRPASTWRSPPPSPPSRRSRPSCTGRRRRSSASTCRSTTRRRSRRAHVAQAGSDRRRAPHAPKKSCATQEQREDEARQSIQRIETEQRDGRRTAVGGAAPAVRGARGRCRPGAACTAEAKAAHAALVERTQRARDRSAAARGRRPRARAARRHARRGAAARTAPARRAARARSRASERQLDDRPAHLRRAARRRSATADEASQELRGAVRRAGSAHPRGAPLARGRARRSRAARSRSARPPSPIWPPRRVVRRDRAGDARRGRGRSRADGARRPARQPEGRSTTRRSRRDRRRSAGGAAAAARREPAPAAAARGR